MHSDSKAGAGRAAELAAAAVFATVWPICLAPAAEADLHASVTITNRTGEDKAHWPVFLTAYKVFGGNLPATTLDPRRFRIYDRSGRQLRRAIRNMPPEASAGNDEIVLLVPRLADGESIRLRVRYADAPARPMAVDLVGNPSNLLPNGGFEADRGGAPAGYVADVRGAKVGLDTEVKHSGRRSLRLTLPVGSAATVKSARPIQFKKDAHYHFSIWAKSDNVAYNGWGFWGGGAAVKFAPAALRGRSRLTLRGTRPWYCYRFDPGGHDAWGVPDSTSRAQTETVRKGHRHLPAELWAKAGGQARLVIAAKQLDQPFLTGKRTGTVWLDEALLFEQPVIAIDRQSGPDHNGSDVAKVFTRPVNTPRWRRFRHEAAGRLEAFAMPGERRQVRFGLEPGHEIENVRVEVSALKAPAGALGRERLDLEILGPRVEPYRPLPKLAKGRTVEYLLGIDVPRGTPAGSYEGVVALAASGAGQGARGLTIRLPLRLAVLPVEAPAMDGYWVGGIYNIGLGMDRNDAFYRCYGKTRFNYLMLFDYLVAKLKGPGLDFAAADRQVAKITKLARVTGGIGLYREPNMSEDQPRKFYQIAAGRPDWAGKYAIGTDQRFRAGYQRLCRQLHEHARTSGWPTLLYMVSDEPSDRRDAHRSMGWLNEALPDAVTLADVQFKDMVRTWQWYRMPVLDDPVDWAGPLVYDFLKARKKRFGFCGTGWGLDAARYQTGLMLASTGARYWHFWHTKGPFEPRAGRVVRTHAVAAMSAGFNDLRYFVALRQRIAEARSGPKAALAAEAEKYLARTLDLAPGDHDRHLMPHNGVPWMWGYDRFYDDWRATMKDYLLRLMAR